MIYRIFLIFQICAVSLFLAGCGDVELRGSDAKELYALSAAPKIDYMIAGEIEVNIYLGGADIGEPDQAGGDQPIIITDGETFAAYIDGALSGKRIYLEIAGTAHEIEITAAAGETQFIDI